MLHSPVVCLGKSSLALPSFPDSIASADSPPAQVSVRMIITNVVWSPPLEGQGLCTQQVSAVSRGCVKKKCSLLLFLAFTLYLKAEP